MSSPAFSLTLKLKYINFFQAKSLNRAAGLFVSVSKQDKLHKKVSWIPRAFWPPARIPFS